VLWISGKADSGHAWLCFFEEVFTEIAWNGSEKVAEASAKGGYWNSVHKASSYFTPHVHTFLTAIPVTKRICEASKKRRSARDIHNEFRTGGLR
jgi:hypothetical protein